VASDRIFSERYTRPFIGKKRVRIRTFRNCIKAIDRAYNSGIEIVHGKKLEKDDTECGHDNPAGTANPGTINHFNGLLIGGLLNRLARRPIFSSTDKNVQTPNGNHQIKADNNRIRKYAKKLGYDRNNDMKKDHSNENIQKSPDVIFKTKNQTERKNEQKQSKNSHYHTNILT
jgi:hypothetical protein